MVWRDQVLGITILRLNVAYDCVDVKIGLSFAMIGLNAHMLGLMRGPGIRI